jgi:hypothetical protein
MDQERLVPDWTQYIATDHDGSVFAFDRKPHLILVDESDDCVWINFPSTGIAKDATAQCEFICLIDGVASFNYKQSCQKVE